ncbi:MAG: threonine/serine dehydratase, partial [Candidatus Heimdallarchaeota archaeon]
ALNRMAQLSPDERRQGVITASSGNHGQAVAFAAEELQLAAKIIVPTNVSKVKLDKIKKYDVELIQYGDYDDVEQKAIEIASKQGLTYISPYNDELIIAGQGTLGLEILEGLDTVDTIIASIGGGGLIAGVALAVKSINPNIQVFGVQSKVAPTMYESYKAGKIVIVEEENSIADGLRGGLEKGAITFELIQNHVNELFLVKEETIKRAIYLLWEKEHQIVEGAGAISIAPILEQKERFRGKTVVSVISGGNIEDTLFQEILREVGERKF